MLLKSTKAAISIAILLLSTSAGWGQGVCDLGVQKVSMIKGRVVSKKEGVPDATIELRRRSDQKELVRYTTTDNEGNFEINNVDNGKYFLRIYLEFFAVMEFAVDLNKGKKMRPARLVAHLAPDFRDACSEGGVESSLLPFGAYRP